jgi:hypothetical protein
MKQLLCALNIALQMKDRRESNINVWLSFMYYIPEIKLCSHLISKTEL